MAVCKKCGAQVPDGNIFCESCGSEIDFDVLPDNIDAQGNVIDPNEAAGEQEPPKKTKRPRSRDKFKMTEGQKRARERTIKAFGILGAVIVVVAAVVLVVNLVGSNKGYNAALKVSLGRNVEYAESETGMTFLKSSHNGMINSMSDFDYICVSEDTVKVSGSEQPAWAIMLCCDENDMIESVEYYDFSQLKLNWQGRKMADLLTESSLTYGMSIKKVNSTLGMKPYYIKRHVSNDSVYCYRYYYTDEKEGYDRAYNYYVGFSDTDMSVRSVSYSEIEYARVILNADIDLRQVTGISDNAVSVTDTEEYSEETEENAEETDEGTEEYSEEQSEE